MQSFQKGNLFFYTPVVFIFHLVHAKLRFLTIYYNVTKVHYFSDWSQSIFL